MKFLIRRIYRITAMILWSSLVSFPALLICIGGWGGIKRVSYITRLWGSGIAKIINLRIHINGELKDVHGGLIVSNHMGYTDIFAHAAAFRIRFVPKKEIVYWPLLGWFLALSRPIWVKRNFRQSSKVLNKFIETMKHGMLLIVYPEGTSTDGKSGILPFKSTPFEAAVEGKLPVFPVVTSYKEVPGHDSVAWYGDATLLPHLWKILAIPYVDVNLHVLPPVYAEWRDRKEFAKYVHELMMEKYKLIT